MTRANAPPRRFFDGWGGAKSWQIAGRADKLEERSRIPAH
jgi:hypothetical protein